MKIKFDKTSIDQLKKSILDLLKGAVVKKALKTFLGTGAGVGLKAWIIKFIVTELFEEIAVPLIKAVLVEAGYQYDKKNGEILITKLHQAREDNDADSYSRTVDDILS